MTRELLKEIRRRAQMHTRIADIGFDSSLYSRAIAKYKRMCNQYSDLVTFTEERGIDKAVEDVVFFYHESHLGVKDTENRERQRNIRRGQ